MRLPFLRTLAGRRAVGPDFSGIRSQGLSGPSLRAFALQLALVLLVLLATKPDKAGDFFEYGVTAIAIAHHGTPDIRVEDAAMAAALSPEAGYRDLFLAMRDNIARGDQVPLPGLYRGKDGAVFSIHFFAYPALAALPLRVLQALGGNPFKAFQVVNFLALWVLGLVLYRFFGASRRAFAALALVLSCGGILYANWCSPEMATAAALLSGTILFVLGRPVAGGLLAGLAAMQNPSLAFFAVFAPLFAVLQARAEGRAPAWRAVLAGSVLAGGLALLPFAFGMWQWHTPSIIARYSTDPQLVGPQRLFSYYFDLSQGMILAVPGILLLLAGAVPRQGRRLALAGALATLAFMLALAVPTLSAVNWNAGGSGIMRYAFWGAMPLLFLAFSWLRGRARWPVGLLCLVFAVQAGAMVHAKRYKYMAFSPLALQVLERAPAFYNPDPEIFVERVHGADGGLDLHAVTAWPRTGQPKKVLFNAGSARVHEVLCGPGRRLAPDLPLVALRDGWRYLNDAPVCVP